VIRSIVCCALLTVSLYSTVEGQQFTPSVSPTMRASSNSHLTFGVFGGAVLPSGEFEDDFAAVGYELGIRLAATRAGSPIGMHVDGEFMKSGAKKGVCADAGCSGQILIASLGLDVGIPIPVTVVRTYATAGVGVAHVELKESETAVPTSSSDGALAWNVGAGVRLRLGEWTSFVEARYVRLANAELGLGTYRTGSHQISLKPVTLGLSFTPCWRCADLGR
jgi:opacity protein-like surface antigen